jgi:hypothetical protein
MWVPTKEAIVFVGTALQTAAVVWIWRDWLMSQYQHADWKREHRQSETQTIKNLRERWGLFAKQFPTSRDDDVLKKRKIEAITQRYGVGPNDGQLVRMRKDLEYLTVIRRGVADYRTLIRRRTFHTALTLLLIGYLMQLWASWPEHWLL